MDFETFFMILWCFPCHLFLIYEHKLRGLFVMHGYWHLVFEGNINKKSNVSEFSLQMGMKPACLWPVCSYLKASSAVNWTGWEQ